MNTEAIQNEVNEIIKEAESMYNFSRMSRATKKAQAELRELGLEQYVPAWVMKDGARADRIVNELIKAVKQDGTQIERGTGHMTADGDGEYIPAQTIPASKLYNLLTETEEEAEADDTEADDTDATDTATREEAEAIAREVWGYRDMAQWDPHGTNTTNVYQSDNGQWYVTRANAYENHSVRMGRTLEQLRQYAMELQSRRDEIGRRMGV